MIRVGTRRSPLAQAQTDRVLARLSSVAAEKVLVESRGDQDLVNPMHRMARPGAFTHALTDAVVEGTVEAAVHSLKDLPLDAPPEAPVVAVLERDDAADLLLLRQDAADPDAPLRLRPGSRVGSSSPRRQSQLLDADPSLVPVDVRGNVQRRLELLRSGVVDGLLMAAAVLDRMPVGLPPGVQAVRLDPVRFPGAPGQGAVAVQARAGTPAAAATAHLDDLDTRAAVDAERAVLRALGGGCGLPLGVHVRRDGAAWVLDGTMGHGEDASGRVRLARCSLRGGDRDALAREAAAVLARPPPEAASPAAAPGAPVVLLALDEEQVHPYAGPLAEGGWNVQAWPLVAAEGTGAPPPEGRDGIGWIAVTSTRAAMHAGKAVADAAGPVRVAAVGAATARALRRAGLPVHVVSPEGTGASLADAIAAFPAPPSPVLAVQAERPAGGLASGLERHGFTVLEWPVYRVRPCPTPPPKLECHAVILTSPAAARAYAGLDALPRVRRVLAFGPTTAQAMRREGVQVDGICPQRSPDGLLAALGPSPAPLTRSITDKEETG